MNRSILLLTVALLLVPMGSQAAPKAQADVSAAFGNTVLTVDPDGRTRKIWLQPDGTWTGLSRRGLALSGKWSVKGEAVCLTQSKPRLFGSMCETFPTSFDKVMEAKDPTGKAVKLKLVKGRVEK